MKSTKLPSEHLQRNPSAGISLLESLLAFAILSIVLASGYTAMSQLAGKESELRHRFLATEFARAALVEYLTPGTGFAQQGTYRDTWTWEISETPADGLFSTSLDSQFAFFKVTARVSSQVRPRLHPVELHRTVARRRPQ